AVLEVVDADVRGLAECHRAQMAGDLESAFMSFVRRRAQLVARDVHVRLERRRAEIGPVTDGTSGVRGIGELVKLRERKPRPREIWTGDVQLRTRDRSRVDPLPEIQVRVRLHTAAGARGGDTGAEVESGEAVRELGVGRRG